MSQETNAPPGGSPVGAPSVSVDQQPKKHTANCHRAKGAPEILASSPPGKMHFEVDRLVYDDRVIIFTETCSAAPKRAREAKRTKGLEGDKLKAVMAGRLLKSLSAILRYRDTHNFKSPGLYHGVLSLAGRVMRFQSVVGGKPCDAEIHWQWARRYCPEATKTAANLAYADSEETVPYLPGPKEAGREAVLRYGEWLMLRPLWGVLPEDASSHRIQEVRKRSKRANDRSRAAARRAEEGARPHANGTARFCRDYDLSQRMYRYYRDKGASKHAHWLAQNGVPLDLSQKVALEDSSSKQKRRGRTQKGAGAESSTK